MSALFGLKEAEQEILISGWIKLHFKDHHRFPLDIIHVLVTFINAIFYWQFSLEKIEQLFNVKNGECIKSESFNIHGIEFILTLFPNGYSKQIPLFGKNGHQYLGQCSVMLYLEIKNWSSSAEISMDNLKSMTIYFELFEKKTKSIWKSTEIFEKDRAYIVRGWNKYCLYSSECKLQNKLNFGVFIDILALNYQNEKLQKPINLSPESDYNWIINECDLEKIPKGRHIYSPNFNNNCFTLYFDGKILGLKLLAKPPEWRFVRVIADFKCNRRPNDDIFAWKTMEKVMTIGRNVMEWQIKNIDPSNTDYDISTSFIEFSVNIKCFKSESLNQI